MTMNYDKLDRETILYITQLEEEVRQLTFITNLNTKEISSLQKENQHLLKEYTDEADKEKKEKFAFVNPNEYKNDEKES